MERIIVSELLVIIALLFALCMLHIKRAKKAVYKAYKAIKQFVNRAWHGLVFYLLWLFPRDKRLVAFGADDGNGFSGNPKYLFLEALKIPAIKPVWITKNHDVYNRMKAQGYKAYMCYSREGIWKQLRAGFLIHSHSIKEDFAYIAVGGATSINCWHGVGLKQSWFRNVNAFAGKWSAAKPSLRRSYHLWWAKTNMARKNYVIGTSEEVIDYYPDTFNVSEEYILNLGQARNDVFYDDDLEDSAIPDFFKEKKVITYMPTHRDYGRKKGKREKEIGRNIDYERLSAVLEEYGYVFVIKQHRWNTGEKALHKKYDNIIDISSDNYTLDSQLIIKYSDIMITDYSSCYTDFLLLDRPIVFYCYDLEEYLEKWDLNFDYDYVTPGPKVFDSDGLIDALEKFMKGEDEYEAERQRVKRVFYSPHNQGPVAEKQMEYIINNIIGK